MKTSYEETVYHDPVEFNKIETESGRQQLQTSKNNTYDTRAVGRSYAEQAGCVSSDSPAPPAEMNVFSNASLHFRSRSAHCKGLAQNTDQTDT